MKNIYVALLALLTACAGPATPPAPDLVTVQYSFSAQAWITDIYSCASEMGVALSIETRAADFLDTSAQLWIRLGEPDKTPSTVYEIGQDEIIVVAHPDNPIHSLAVSDLRALFSGEMQNWNELGGEDVPVQVWTYSPGEDIRQIFDTALMRQRLISSQARLAFDAESMVTGIVSDTGAIGFLPRSLVSADVQVISVKGLSPSTSTPVLLIPSSTDQTLSNLIACLQGN